MSLIGAANRIELTDLPVVFGGGDGLHHVSPDIGRPDLEMIGFGPVLSLIVGKRTHIIIKRFILEWFQDIAQCEQHELQRRDALLAIDHVTRGDDLRVIVDGAADDNGAQKMLAQRLQLLRIAEFCGVRAVLVKGLHAVDDIFPQGLNLIGQRPHIAALKERDKVLLPLLE
jgi:hypothetical protein